MQFIFCMFAVLVVSEIVSHEELKRKIEQDIADAVLKKMNATINFVQAKMETYTPVWTGRAAVSYNWTIGSAQAINREPIAGGPPGQGRRSASINFFRSLKPKLVDQPYVSVHLSNGAQYEDGTSIEEVEFGEFETSAPAEGMFGRMAIEVAAKYGDS